MSIVAGGIIGRFVRTADGELAFPPTQEYLQTDGERPVWTRDRAAAFFFPAYSAADDRARELHAFALVTGKAMPRREFVCNVPEPAPPPMASAALPLAPARQRTVRRSHAPRRSVSAAMADRMQKLRERHEELERSGWA